MKRIISAFIAVLLLLSGCATEYKESGATVLCEEFYGEFNPLFAKSSGDEDVCTLLFDSLVETGETGEVIAAMADWEVLDEGQRYRFKIKNNAFFSNGEPVLAQDVLFTIELMAKEGLGNIAASGISGLGDFISGKSSEILGFELSGDDKSFSVYTDKADNGFLNYLTFGILSHAYYGKAYENSGIAGVYALNGKPVGSGQYVLSRYEKGVVSLISNPEYYKGEPKIKHVSLKCSDGDAEFDVCQTWEAGKILKNNVKSGYNVQNVKNGDFYVLGFNCDSDVLSNADVRRAVKAASDREKISMEISGSDAGVPEMLGVSYIADMKKAEEYMEKAGFTKNDEGMYLKNKEKITLKVLMMPDLIGEKVFEVFAENMKELGIEAVAEYPADFAGQTEKGEWDLYLLPLRENSAYLMKNAFEKESEKNIYSFESEAFENAAKGHESNTLSEKMQEVIADEVPVLPLYEKVQTLIIKNEAGDIYFSPYRSVLKNMYKIEYKNK